MKNRTKKELEDTLRRRNILISEQTRKIQELEEQIGKLKK